MINWQERITRESSPAIRVEHEARYRLAAPLILESVTWCDLGCGNGVAAASALAGTQPPRLVLVDREDGVVQTAIEELGAPTAAPVTADLTVAGDIAQVREAILGGPDGARVVTVFELVEHLSNFLPLIEALVALSRDADVDVVMSMPNDAFWAIENPHHQTMWSEGAFEELRRLLPPGTVVLRQVALGGSLIAPLEADGQARTEVDTHVAVDVPATVPTHLLAAFGPRAHTLGVTTGVHAVDLDGHRQFEREREAAVSVVEELVAIVHDQTQHIRRHANSLTQWRAEAWRAYVNELERRLELPLTSTTDETPPTLR